MARMLIKTSDGALAYRSADTEVSEADVKKFADFLAAVQSGDKHATTSVEFTTDNGIVYIMPQAITVIMRVED